VTPVLPPVPCRHFVLSVSKILRRLFLRDRRLLADLSRCGRRALKTVIRASGFPMKTLERFFRHKVLRMLLEKGRITPEPSRIRDRWPALVPGGAQRIGLSGLGRFPLLPAQIPAEDARCIPISRPPAPSHPLRCGTGPNRLCVLFVGMPLRAVLFFARREANSDPYSRTVLFFPRREANPCP